jgi:hypothetical protein
MVCVVSATWRRHVGMLVVLGGKHPRHNADITSQGVEVKFIPPDCTGMVQPVDGGYNKPLKSKFRDQYCQWMLDQDPNQSIPCPSRVLIAKWLIAAQQLLMTPAIISDAWKKIGFSWFPNQSKD